MAHVGRVPEEEVSVEPSAPKASIGSKIGNLAAGATGALGVGLGNLFSGAKGAFGAVAGTASKAASGVAGALNISQKAASVALTAALVAGGGSGAYIVGSLLDDDMGKRYVSGPTCKEMVEDAKKKYGFGEREIPEKVGQYYLGRVNTVEFTIGVGLDGAGNWVGWRGNGTPQSKIGEWAEQNGGEDSRGFSMVGDYYIAAIAPMPWGITEEQPANVGDWITVYMENGESFEMIVGDTKGDVVNDSLDLGRQVDYSKEPEMWDQPIKVMTPTGEATICAWGHMVGDSDVDIIEFWGEPSKINMNAYELMGFKGMRPVSFTNHGLAPELEGIVTGGALESAGANQRNARSKGLAGAANQCKKDCDKPSYDNSTLVNAALSFAYSQGISGTDGTQVWQDLYNRYTAEGKTNGHIRSCDTTVQLAIRWSGTDKDIPAGACKAIRDHFIASPNWEEVDWKPGDSFDKLQPGDVFVNGAPPIGEHISLYVGEEAIKNWTFEGDADVGPSPAGSYSVSGSLDTRAPGVTSDYGRIDENPSDSGVYRFVGEPSGEGGDGIIEGVSAGDLTTASGCSDKKKKQSKKTINGLTASDKLDGFVIPIKKGKYTISSEFGPRWGTSHNGIDMAASEGTEIGASGPGTVVHLGHDPDGGMGNNVWIAHPNGKLTIYMHMVRHAPGLKQGDKVKAADLIGYVGTTGDSTGPHLHFEVWEDHGRTRVTNPREYFDF